MLKTLAAIALLAMSSSAISASQVDSAVIKDTEQTTTLALNKNSWSYMAAGAKGMSKVREFYDMGDAGVQQLDYVVNCSNGKLALASFKVLTAMSSDMGASTEPSFNSVSFYKPVIQHDMNIVENVCGSRIASTAAAQAN